MPVEVRLMNDIEKQEVKDLIKDIELDIRETEIVIELLKKTKMNYASMFNILHERIDRKHKRIKQLEDFLARESE